MWTVELQKSVQIGKIWLDSIVFNEFLTKGFLDQVLLTLGVNQSLNFPSALARISLYLWLESELWVAFVIYIFFLLLEIRI